MTLWVRIVGWEGSISDPARANPVPSESKSSSKSRQAAYHFVQ